MKIAKAQFINVVMCGGSLTNITAGQVVGDRPGQTAFDIDLVDVGGIPCMHISKTVAGKLLSAHVPIFNVAAFSPMTEAQLAALKKQDEEKTALTKKAKEDADALVKKAEVKK